MKSLGTVQKKRKKRLCKSHSSFHKTKNLKTSNECSLDFLDSDSLEHISCFLDTKSALALYRSSRTINQKLTPCTRFWKSLCKNENFQDYTALKSDEGQETASRLTWTGEKLHGDDGQIPEDAKLWHKIFVRGIQMRRNICSGRYELWRLFMTDEDSLPVKRMTEKTKFRELRSSHRRSSFNNPNRRVRINRYWNEDYLIAIQHNGHFNDIFIWSWTECQNPKFLYSYDMFPLYPTGLFPTAFFMHKNYLVLMPETCHILEGTQTKTMIRVHDLAENMALVGSYDFPLDGDRRHVNPNISVEAAHLHKVGDKAVALCRIPQLMFFIFSIPNCELLHQVSLPLDPERPLELDELDQRFLMMDTTVMYMFHDPTFFDHLDGQGDQPFEKKYGRLLLVDFENFLKFGQPIKQMLDNKFECNDDYIEKISLISKNKMVCAMMSGRLVVRDIKFSHELFHSISIHGRGGGAATNKQSIIQNFAFIESLSIPCPEPLQEEPDELLDPDLETDGPALCTSRSGDLLLVMRHFATGRKIHTYNGDGSHLYTINIDAPELGLERQCGYVSIDMDGNFVCAADQNKVLIWNNNNGKLVNTIQIPKHYNFREDPAERHDRGCWKGHTDFAFAEDGIIIIHSQRNFPAAADVMLFW